MHIKPGRKQAGGIKERRQSGRLVALTHALSVVRSISLLPAGKNIAPLLTASAKAFWSGKRKIKKDMINHQGRTLKEKSGASRRKRYVCTVSGPLPVIHQQIYALITAEQKKRNSTSV